MTQTDARRDHGAPSDDDDAHTREGKKRKHKQLANFYKGKDVVSVGAPHMTTTTTTHHGAKMADDDKDDDDAPLTRVNHKRQRTKTPQEPPTPKKKKKKAAKRLPKGIARLELGAIDAQLAHLLDARKFVKALPVGRTLKCRTEWPLKADGNRHSGWDKRLDHCVGYQPSTRTCVVRQEVIVTNEQVCFDSFHVAHTRADAKGLMRREVGSDIFVGLLRCSRFGECSEAHATCDNCEGGGNSVYCDHDFCDFCEEFTDDGATYIRVRIDTSKLV